MVAIAKIKNEPINNLFLLIIRKMKKPEKNKDNNPALLVVKISARARHTDIKKYKVLFSLEVK
jgi:hypothetical protein